ncbi:uncharacterized protein [Henckelia pumila]|uniref:uncharacterized protein n=1 Tax=Henckelia pumila TaxID=405737 RepID=UPI003C6E725C
MAQFNCSLSLNNAETPFPIMGSSETSPKQPQSHQNVVVMRHGDRVDYINPLWTATAARPWDPPLIDSGKARAFRTGWRIRKELGIPIHRVFVSPFLRCLQTACGAVTALSAVEDKSAELDGFELSGVVIDPSIIKVSIEYGLCEMLNSRAIKPNVAPKDGIFSFDISNCEAELPAGTVDNSVEQIYKELPKWQETAEATRARYLDVIKALADKYPSENLLLVTHGEGVASSLCRFVKDVDMICEVEYCAYSHLRRPILFGGNNSFTAGDFVGSPEGQVGVTYLLVNKESDNPQQNSK